MSELGTDNDTHGTPTRWWTRALIVGCVIMLVMLVMAPFGYRIGALTLPTSLFYVLGGAAVLAVLGSVLGIAALIAAVRGGLVSDRNAAVLTTLASVLVVGYLGGQMATANSVPPIHDIATDVADPPEFVAVPALRGANANPLVRDDAVDQAQLGAYPDLAPQRLQIGREEALARAERALIAQDVAIVHRDPDAGVVEGTATTRFFGFEDDVVIRVRGGDQGPVTVDMRSVSRVGQSDIGVNAARIRALQAELAR